MLDNGDSLDWLNVDWLLDVVNLLDRVGVLHLEKATLSNSPDCSRAPFMIQEKISYLLKIRFCCIASPIFFNQNKKREKAYLDGSRLASGAGRASLSDRRKEDGDEGRRRRREGRRRSVARAPSEKPFL